MDPIQKGTEKVVIHYHDGKILKGYIQPLQLFEEKALFTGQEKDPTETLKISLKDLKAIYYVKAHEKNKGYREKKFRSWKKQRKKGYGHIQRSRTGLRVCNRPASLDLRKKQTRSRSIPVWVFSFSC